MESCPNKPDIPQRSGIAPLKERRTQYKSTHGLLSRLLNTIDEDKDNPVGRRMFVSRFGDLQSTEIHDGEDDFVLTSDGARHQIGGYANDAGSRLYLYVDGQEREQIVWNDLSEIRFPSVPSKSKPYAERLYGSVETTYGTHEGFIQWDQSECTTIDTLDGEQDKKDIEPPMGKIRSISRASGKSVTV